MAMPRKVVVKLNIHDDKDKAKAMKAVSCIEGIISIGVDMKESKMTIVGDVDPVQVVAKLRKQWCAQIVIVGPFKDEKQIKEEAAKKKKEEEEKKRKEEEEEEKKQNAKEEEERKKLCKLLKKYGSKPPQCPPPCPPRPCPPPQCPPPCPPTPCPPPQCPPTPCPPTPCPPPSSCPPYYYVQSMEENPNSCVIC